MSFKFIFILGALFFASGGEFVSHAVSPIQFLRNRAGLDCSMVLTDSRVLSAGSYREVFPRVRGAPRLPAEGLPTGMGRKFVAESLVLTPHEREVFLEPITNELFPELKARRQVLENLLLANPFRTPLERIAIVLMTHRLARPYQSLASVELPTDWIREEVRIAQSHLREGSLYERALVSLTSESTFRYGDWVNLTVDLAKEWNDRRLLRDRLRFSLSPQGIPPEKLLEEIRRSFLEPHTAVRIPIPTTLRLGLRDWSGITDPAQLNWQLESADGAVLGPVAFLYHDAIVHVEPKQRVFRGHQGVLQRSRRELQIVSMDQQLNELRAAIEHQTEINDWAQTLLTLEARHEYALSLVYEGLIFNFDHEEPSLHPVSYLRNLRARAPRPQLGNLMRYNVRRSLQASGYSRDWVNWLSTESLSEQMIEILTID